MSRRSGGSVLVAVVPNLFAPGGGEAAELARSLEGKREGRCLYIEADMDALALIGEAEEAGAEELVLLGPGEGPVLEKVEPIDARGMDPGRVVKELWMNLTGSLGLEDYVAALRILYGRPFYVARCGSGRSCQEVLRLVRERFCGAGEG